MSPLSHRAEPAFFSFLLFTPHGVCAWFFFAFLWVWVGFCGWVYLKVEHPVLWTWVFPALARAFTSPEVAECSFSIGGDTRAIHELVPRNGFGNVS